MRFIHVDGNAVEVNYMFLPTFLGLNSALLQEMEGQIAPLLVGKEATDDVLDAANDAVLDFIEKRFPDIEGLRDYLDAVKFIQEKK
jgi:hypothetical protein